MSERSPKQAFERLQELAEDNPHVEQDLSQWDDLELEETSPGTWQLMINGDPEQIIYFDNSDLSVNDIYAARQYVSGQGDYPFYPQITIDSPRGSEPGPLAGIDPAELRERVQETVRRTNVKIFGDEAGYKPEPKPEPTLGDKVKRLVRKVALRLGIRPPW